LQSRLILLGSSFSKHIFIHDILALLILMVVYVILDSVKFIGELRFLIFVSCLQILILVYIICTIICLFIVFREVSLVFLIRFVGLRDLLARETFQHVMRAYIVPPIA